VFFLKERLTERVQHARAPNKRSQYGTLLASLFETPLTCTLRLRRPRGRAAAAR
jgi:hypothetical protein